MSYCGMNPTLVLLKGPAHMASEKKRHKRAAQQRRLNQAGAPRKVRDGDRRRRPLTDLVRDELNRKARERDWTIDDQSIDWSALGP